MSASHQAEVKSAPMNAAGSHRDDPLIGSMMKLRGGYYGAWFVDVPWFDAKKAKLKGATRS
ncbi:MAG TPA: hypothetical protein VMR02_05330 [Terracidiphilus sp.]|jgi:hypothetical protein|nr:hypothetical protein [Terracidiphilus sp.]